jgi:hypothetical protein
LQWQSFVALNRFHAWKIGANNLPLCSQRGFYTIDCSLLPSEPFLRNTIFFEQSERKQSIIGSIVNSCCQIVRVQHTKMEKWYQIPHNNIPKGIHQIQNKHQIYQMAIKYTEWPWNFQMAVKYMNLFHSKAIQNIPKLESLVCKYTLWGTMAMYSAVVRHLVVKLHKRPSYYIKQVVKIAAKTNISQIHCEYTYIIDVERFNCRNLWTTKIQTNFISNKLHSKKLHFEQTSFEQTSFEQPSFEQPSFEETLFKQTSIKQTSFEQPSIKQPSFEQTLFKETSIKQT